MIVGGIYVSTSGVGDVAGAKEPATVNLVSVTNSISNTAAAGDLSTTSTGERVIRWSSTGFPDGAKVNISLLRMINDDPIEYEFVRAIATDAPNSGEISWTPLAEDLGEDGADLYISIECANATSFEQGCNVTSAPIRATDFTPEPAPQPTESE